MATFLSSHVLSIWNDVAPVSRVDETKSIRSTDVIVRTSHVHNVDLTCRSCCSSPTTAGIGFSALTGCMHHVVFTDVQYTEPDARLMDSLRTNALYSGRIVTSRICTENIIPRVRDLPINAGLKQLTLKTSRGAPFTFSVERRLSHW